MTATCRQDVDGKYAEKERRASRCIALTLINKKTYGGRTPPQAYRGKKLMYHNELEQLVVREARKAGARGHQTKVWA